MNSDTDYVTIFINYVDEDDDGQKQLRSQILSIQSGPITRDMWQHSVVAVVPATSKCKAVVVNFRLPGSMKAYLDGESKCNLHGHSKMFYVKSNYSWFLLNRNPDCA